MNGHDFRWSDFNEMPPPGRIAQQFLASDQPSRNQPRALLVYLHGWGERAEKRVPGGTSLRNNTNLIPNVLENADVTATFVRERFVVAVPHAHLVGPDSNPQEWECAGLWGCLKAFYGRYVRKGLTGAIYITGVSMGGTGTWRLASEIISDPESPFKLKAIAAVDVHESGLNLDWGRLRGVRALGMRTNHITHPATEVALNAVGQDGNFIDRTETKYNLAWGELYGRRRFYEWLLDADAPPAGEMFP